MRGLTSFLSKYEWLAESLPRRARAASARVSLVLNDYVLMTV